MQRFPLPVKKGAKKEEKKGAAVAEPKVIENESNETALSKAVSWNNAANIFNKVSVGTLTTAKYHEKVMVFELMNGKAREHSAIIP